MNLVTLHQKCHRWVHSNENTEGLFLVRHEELQQAS